MNLVEMTTCLVAANPAFDEVIDEVETCCECISHDKWWDTFVTKALALSQNSPGDCDFSALVQLSPPRLAVGSCFVECAFSV